MSSGVWAVWAPVCRSTARPTRSSAKRPPSAGPGSCSAGRSHPAARPATRSSPSAQLARVASDRARDLDESLREEVLARLTELGADETALRPVREYHELETAQQVQALGDSLPIGLRLLSDCYCLERRDRLVDVDRRCSKLQLRTTSTVLSVTARSAEP